MQALGDKLDAVSNPNPNPNPNPNQALGDRLDAVYDVTLAYTLHPLAVPTSADADAPRPSEPDFRRGTLPRTVHRDVQLTLTLTLTRTRTRTLTLTLPR